MKPGSKDKQYRILITGRELEELQRFTWQMAESFGPRNPPMGRQEKVRLRSLLQPCQRTAKKPMTIRFMMSSV
jgi:hypothetical protein